MKLNIRTLFGTSVLRNSARWLILILMVLIMLVSQDKETQPDQWTMMEPGGDTTCADGSTFRYFVREGSADDSNLLIYFQEGGACWNRVTCDPISQTYYKKAEEDEMQVFRYIFEFDGIFNFQRDDNPMIDFDVVFIPYCTGDVHAGSATVTYPMLGFLDLTIHHRGYENVTTVLDWVYTNYPDPERIVIAGSSAGAIASIFHAPPIMAHYPNAQVTQIADGYVGVVPVGWEALQTWNVFENMPDYLADIDPDTFDINMLYRAHGEQFPQHTFSQFTTSIDAFQLGYFNLVGGDLRDWQRRMYSLLDDLEENLDNFRYYIADGPWHTILPFARFYTTSADEIRFRNWFADLIAGGPVENVRCENCTGPE